MGCLYEKRVFRTGDGGLAIHLPVAWCRFYELKARDKVTLIADADITIRPAPVQAKA